VSPSRQDASPRSLGRAHAHLLLWRLRKPACRVSSETSSGKESSSRLCCSVLPGRSSVDRRDASSSGAEYRDVALLSFPVFPRVELTVPSSLTIWVGAETSGKSRQGRQAAGQAPRHTPRRSNPSQQQSSLNFSHSAAANPNISSSTSTTPRYNRASTTRRARPRIPKSPPKILQRISRRFLTHFCPFNFSRNINNAWR
jgi:hypothetical protein